MENRSTAESTAKKFTIEDAPGGDNSVVLMNPRDLEELNLFKGDVVVLKAGSYETVAIVITEDMAISSVRINKTIRNNLRANIKDNLEMSPLTDIQYSKRVHILPFEDTIKKELEKDLFNDYLKPYFQDAYRPVKDGDTFLYNGVEFKILTVEPGPYGIIAPETIIHCEGEPLQRKTDS
mmetsp:Transcript_65743/g.76448  ORF Transcript_65743/g.76448 Transcript_65743/m.76448 type:complete len:179 (+) Transcript_65743:29-565(+)